MSVETALWVLGCCLPPAIGWCCWTTVAITRLLRDSSRLAHMHEHPEDFGFGTTRTNLIIEDNTRAMTALTHYIQWLVTEQTGKTPPPPVDGINLRGPKS